MHPARSQPLYTQAMDEATLFEEGVASWRMDIATYRSIRGSLDRVIWVPVDEAEIPEDSPDNRPDAPLGLLRPSDADSVRLAFDRMLNDPVLAPNLRQMGRLRTGPVEIQNGAYDATWHHDGLSGRRIGHRGDFFVIAYFGEATWEDSWGGYFEYGRRPLRGTWAREDFTPDPPIRRIAPTERTVLLGWNQHPALVHRAPSVKGHHQRITLIAPVALDPEE